MEGGYCSLYEFSRLRFAQAIYWNERVNELYYVMISVYDTINELHERIDAYVTDWSLHSIYLF
jgi:hypothetical protein